MNDGHAEAGAAPAPRLRAADWTWCGLGAFFAIAATDAVLCLRPAVRPAAEATARVVWTSAAWSTALAAPCALVMLALVALGFRLGGDRGRRRALMPAPAAIAYGLVVGAAGAALLSGRGARVRPLLDLLRQHVAWIAPLAAWIVALPLAAALRRACRSAPGRLLVGASGLLIVVGCGAFDAFVHPERYEEAHALSRMAAALVGGGALALAASGRGARVAGILAVVVALAAGAALLRDPLAGRPAARAAAFRATSFLRLALAYVAPPPPPPPVADLSSLPPPPPDGRLDPATLDRAFPRRRDFDLVFISVDALRGDRVEFARGGRPVMPRLAAFAKESVRFDAAWTPAPVTSYAFSSIFSGLEGGATDVARLMIAEGKTLDRRSQPILSERLVGAGRRTEAVLGFDPKMLRLFFGTIAQGFQDVNRDPRMKVRPLPASHVTAAGLEAFDRDPGRRVFLWVHYFDPHGPYTPDAATFGTSQFELYDAEVEATDREIGRLVDGIRARGRLDSTVIVIFGDHGEQFDDGVPKYHATKVNEQQVHVPFVVHVPGAAPRVVARPTSLVNLTPTIEDLLDLPPEPAHGRSLLPEILGVPSDERPVYVELFDPEPQLPSRQYALRDGRLKIWIDERAGTEGLYDVVADPLERVNLIEERPEDAARLRALVRTARLRATLPPPPVASRPTAPR